VATPREQLADALRQARQDAGFTSHAALAKVLKRSRPVITRAENPREAVPAHDLIVSWAAATGADLEKLQDYAKRARYPRQGFAVWADDFEPRATLIRWFEPLLIPGFLQTENYMRAVVSWKPNSATADETFKERLARQSVLDRAELRVLILGSVLDRDAGDPSVMCEQIQHVLSVATRPSVMLHIVPDTPSVLGGLGGAFGIATEGTADVAAYSGSIIRGGVHTDPDLITRAVRTFDGLRADALSWAETQDFLQKADERWRQRT
jgi:transcriptional regulator with XRE-family HTH domain